MQTDTPGTAPARVLLADDHDILRQGLKLLLSLQPEEIQVVGEARTGREAVELARALQPDVVVMDITMPDMDGLEACRIIHQEQPATQVVMLTMHESEEYFLQSLRVGAAGYVVKKAAPTELRMAIQSVAQGGAFLYPGLAKALIRSFVEHSPAASPDTRIILLTGWGQNFAGSEDQPLPVDRLLPKPTRMRELRAVLAELTEQTH